MTVRMPNGKDYDVTLTEKNKPKICPLWQHRPRDLVLYDMLTTVKRYRRARAMQLRRGAKMDSNSFRRYINVLKDQGLIGEHNRMFYLTMKGEEFLEILGRLIRMVDG